MTSSRIAPLPRDDDHDLELLDQLASARAALNEQIARRIIGQREVVDNLVAAMLSGGHALLVGVPGLAKTLLVQTVAQALDLQFSRVQFTPDLMPTDITGTDVIEEDQATGRRAVRFIQGPVFANIVLADEINRTPPKTQAALLQAMQEKRVTAGGRTYRLPEPFLVFATQNPIEQEGTYPLPEAQLDRFIFKVMVPFPSEEDLIAIMDRTTGSGSVTASKVCTAAEIVEMQRLARAVPIAPHVTAYAVSVLAATHPDQPRAPELVRDYVRYGGSPRGAQALVTAGKIYALLDGRFNVSIDDIRAVALPSLRHRIILNFEGEAEGITSEAVVRSILDTIAAPTVE